MFDIQTTRCSYTGRWTSIDADTYDVDCDEAGFFSKSPVGTGSTPLDAIVDLLDRIEERTAPYPRSF